MLGGIGSHASDSTHHSADSRSGNSAGISVQPRMGILPERNAEYDFAHSVGSVLTALRLRPLTDEWSVSESLQLQSGAQGVSPAG